MLEQFNDFMEALDQQIDALNKEIANLENKKANLNRAREQFVETSKLLNTDDEDINIVREPQIESIESDNNLDEDSYTKDYSAETSNSYEEILPDIDYEDIVPVDEEKLEVTPVEDATVSPIEVYDNNKISQVGGINTEIDNSLLANLDFNINE